MPPRLYAHRGAASELPENTLEAFRRALVVGATALETDAHLSKDGHVVLSHDPTAARMAGVPRAFCTATLAEIRTWDAGYGFVDRAGARPFAGRGFRFPTLEELLAAFPDVPINVDAKQRSPSMVAPLVETVRRMHAEERVTVASFDTRTLRAVRAAGYRGPTSLGRAEVLRAIFVPRALHRLRPLRGTAAQIPDRAGVLDLGTRRVIAKCHALGLVVHYWTIDDRARAAELLARGADGIMTNDPAHLAPLFGVVPA